MKKQVKESELKEMEVVQPEVVTAEQKPTVKLTEDDVNYFLNIMNVVLYKDERFKVLQNHFLDLLNSKNEPNKEQ